MFKNKKAGFTLVEAMIATGIVLMLTIGIASLYAQSIETTMLIRNRSGANFSVQEAVERLVDEVRNSDGFTEIQDDAFTINMRGSSVRYSYNSELKQIRRNNTPYVSNVTAFTPTYFTSSGTGGGSAAVGSPSSVAELRLAVTATDRGSARTVSTSVFVRRTL